MEPVAHLWSTFVAAHTVGEVPWEEVVRGYEYHDHLVVLTEEQLGTLALKEEHTVQLFQCVGTDEVDPLYFDKAYYLEPEAGGRNAYVLLRDLLSLKFASNWL